MKFVCNFKEVFDDTLEKYGTPIKIYPYYHFGWILEYEDFKIILGMR